MYWQQENFTGQKTNKQITKHKFRTNGSPPVFATFSAGGTSPWQKFLRYFPTLVQKLEEKNFFYFCRPSYIHTNKHLLVFCTFPSLINVNDILWSSIAPNVSLPWPERPKGANDEVKQARRGQRAQRAAN